MVKIEFPEFENHAGYVLSSIGFNLANNTKLNLCNQWGC